LLLWKKPLVLEKELLLLWFHPHQKTSSSMLGSPEPCVSLAGAVPCIGHEQNEELQRRRRRDALPKMAWLVT